MNWKGVLIITIAIITVTYLAFKHFGLDISRAIDDLWETQKEFVEIIIDKTEEQTKM